MHPAKKDNPQEALEKRLKAAEAMIRQLMDLNNAITPSRTREQLLYEEMQAAKTEIEEKEKEKTLQLAAIAAVTNYADWGRKCAALADVFHGNIPFDYAVIGFENTDRLYRSYGFQRLGKEEYRPITMTDFQRMCGISEANYHLWRRQWKPDGSIMLNGESFKATALRFKIHQLRARILGVRSAMGISFTVTDEASFTMIFYSCKEDVFTRSQLALLEKSTSHLAIALEKLIALEDLEAKQKQIENLNSQLKQQNNYRLDEGKQHYDYAEIIGNSSAMHEVFKSVGLVAPNNTSVLITGETGTGKELIARAIHDASSRKDRPLIKLNCAVLPPQLVESELFGHERGAFTGAVDRRIGKFEMANNSTLFLDEIGELPLDLQAKLLRALQEREFERLGSNKVIKTDVRIVAATNRNLTREVAEGRFRSDLFYRLNVFPIHLPPLRQRKEDIPLLCSHFVFKMAKKLGKNIQGVSNKVLNDLLAYEWPGNIREMEHLIERSSILSPGPVIQNITLPPSSLSGKVEEKTANDIMSLEENERQHIVRALKRCNNKISGPGGVAQLLKIKPTTLMSRMEKLGIRRISGWA